MSQIYPAAAAESGKPLLKKLWHAASKQQEAAFFCVCLEFLFKLSQTFNLI